MLRSVIFCLVLLASVIAIWFVVVALSPSYNSCVQNNGAHSTEHYTSNDQQIVEGPINNPTRLRLLLVCGSYFANRNGEAFTGLFTIALTVATFLLAYLAWDQGRTTRAQLRAYVSITSVAVDFLQTEKRLRATLTVSNNGQTPAYHVQHKAGFRVGRDHISDPFSGDEIFDQSTMLAPHGESFITTYLQAPDDPLPMGQRPPVFIVVHTDYRDVFKNRRWSTFQCQVIKDITTGYQTRPTDKGTHGD